jgi:hypothetical protein
VLPDIPVKERGWDEERYLFDQLLSAAEHVTLSWSRSEAGKELARSPFVDRLIVGGAVEQVALGPGTAAGSGPRTAMERVVEAGLDGDREGWRPVLRVAIDEGRRRLLAAPDPGFRSSLAAIARRAVLDELDPESPRSDLGPFSGCVGAVADDDPRTGQIAVSVLEAVARCPWQAFVEKVLRITALPDPLLELPQAPIRLVGSVVHEVLDAIVSEVVGPPAVLPQLHLRLPHSVPWPHERRLDRLLSAAARTVARKEGLWQWGIAPMLEVLARPYLEVARRLDWEPGPPLVLGAEVDGVVQVGEARLGMRVDRVDAGEAGRCLTDYKTGTRRVTDDGVVKAIGRGELLQSVAYVLADGGPASRGRYLYLKPDPEGDGALHRPLEVAGEPGELEAFERSVETIVAAWKVGAFVPRVADRGKDSDGGWCRSCEVQQACLQGDSTFNRRLRRWRFRGESAAPDEASGAVQGAALALWWLGDGVPAGGADGAGEDG